ncbi:MAG: nuclear transport factor 2 family protein [Gemmatimonadaceae bacterium]
MTKRMIGLTFTAVAIILSVVRTDRATEAIAAQPNTVRGALAAAARFHAALARGDSAAAAELLDSEAMILESGYLETRAEYLAHHLGEDIEFAKALPSQRTITQAKREGNVAWIVATSVLKGTFKEKAIDSRGAELMVLSRSGSEWRIRSIHWSSRKAPAP